jgi:exodeoxyribonuclease V gamma subunit
MGRLYLTTSTEQAAERLTQKLAAGGADPFVPQTIVVPNRNVKKWLQLRLARGLGVCANFRLVYLEAALWEELAKGQEEPAPQLLDENILSQFILAALLSGDAAQNDDLRPLREYVGGGAVAAGLGGQSQNAAPMARAWQLAERLGQLFRDYEFSRPDWVRQWLAGSTPGSGDALSQSEVALYRMIFAPGGLRDRFAKGDEPKLLTLGELAARQPTGNKKTEAAAQPLHFFALTQVAPLHVRLLQRVAASAELQIYCVTPLAERLVGAADLPGAVGTLLGEPRDRDDPLQLWGAAAVECLRLLRPLFLDQGKVKAPLKLELIEPKSPAKAQGAKSGALAALRRVSLTGKFPDQTERAPNDGSLAILACPSIRREVQTVYNSILDHLHRDRELRLSDIAVLVSDMSVYRTAITSEFDAPGARLPFNLTDFSARDASTYGHAMMALLDLPLGRFARNEVCNLLVNPSFLARAGISREQVNQWIAYARELGICHGFDDGQRRELGYGAGELGTWNLGLRRLRLGRVFDCGCGNLEAGEAQAFGDAVPFAPGVDQDEQSLGLFCELIERLYRQVRRLRSLVAPAEQWRDELRALADQFLAVPTDRPDEQQVRDALNDALDELLVWDKIRAAQPRVPEIDLQFVRQHIGHRLSSLSSTLGTYLGGGVTVSQLKPLRPLPFRICYVLGLGEGFFPGETTGSALNLRQQVGADSGGIDIETPHLNRLLFLETLVSTSDRVYLSYVSNDLQREQELGPSAVIIQLMRVMGKTLKTDKPLEITKVPLLGSDVKYLPRSGKPGELPNFSAIDRLLCLLNPANGFAGPRASAEFTRAVAKAERKVREDFSPAVAAPAGDSSSASHVVQSSQLKVFLRNPVEAVLQRQLQLKDEQEPAAIDDEPFFSIFPADWQCKEALVARFAMRAAESSSIQALANLENDLDARIAIARKTGQMPDGSFGQVDRQRLLADIRQVIGEVADGNSLAHFLDSQRQSDGGDVGRDRRFYSRLVVGQSRSASLPLAFVAGDRTLRLPPLKLQADGRQIVLHGAARFVWVGPDSVEALVFDLRSDPDAIGHHLLEPFVTLLMAVASGDGRFAGKAIKLHLARRKGVESLELGVVDAASAQKYLTKLCSDYLKTDRLDELPMEFAVKALSEKPDEHTDESLREEIVEQIAAADDTPKPAYRRMDLLEVIEPDVPANALELTMRRFEMLLAASRAASGGQS